MCVCVCVHTHTHTHTHTMLVVEGGFQNGDCTSVHVVEQAHKNDCHKYLCPRGELQLPSASPGDSSRSAGSYSSRSAGGSDSGSFEITTSALKVPAHVRVCVPFKRLHSISHSPLVLPDVSPTDLQSQTFWGLVFLA